MEIDRNKAINKNIEKLLSPEFERRFRGVLEDKGKIQSFADMKYNQAGELEFNGQNMGTVRFYVDTTYKFKKNILNYLCQKLGISDHPKNRYLASALQYRFFWFTERNKWNIDEVYFIGRESVNRDIKDIMNKAKEYVNNLSRKERKQYSPRIKA
jgi:hypothetical protein